MKYFIYYLYLEVNIAGNTQVCTLSHRADYVLVNLMFFSKVECTYFGVFMLCSCHAIWRCNIFTRTLSVVTTLQCFRYIYHVLYSVKCLLFVISYLYFHSQLIVFHFELIFVFALINILYTSNKAAKCGILSEPIEHFLLCRALSFWSQ